MNFPPPLPLNRQTAVRQFVPYAIRIANRIYNDCNGDNTCINRELTRFRHSAYFHTIRNRIREIQIEHMHIQRQIGERRPPQSSIKQVRRLFGSKRRLRSRSRSRSKN